MIHLLLIGAGLFLARPSAATPAAGGILDYPASARAAAMGEAYVAADDDVFGVLYNPAVDLKTRQAGMMYERGFADDELQFLGFGAPVGFGRLAATLLSYDAGDITLNSTSNQSTTVQAQRDYLGTFSAAGSPASGLMLGGNFKVLHSRLVEDVSATAYLWDVGAIYRPASFLGLGVAAQNLGTSLRGEPESQVVRAGFSLKDHWYAHHVELAFDEIVSTRDSSLREHVGFEYKYGTMIAARVGYKFGDDYGGITTGAGVTFQNLSFDFAILPSSQWGGTEQISTTLRF
jgi:hypothetical protein